MISLPDVHHGDELFLYSTRRAFNNPGRDRGRVFGRARASGEIRPLRRPLVVAGREFGSVCELNLVELALPRAGVELGSLVSKMTTFKDSSAWSAFLRRPILKITESDARLLGERLARVARTPEEGIPAYVALATPRRVRTIA
jgi:hypothetical protein